MAPHVRLARMSLSTRSLGGAVLLAAAAGAAQAQRRQLAADNPQARLMGFYAAVMQFTPTGLPESGSRLEVGGELTFVPRLSARERQVGFGGLKDEDTNFCPVFPRLRVARSFGAFAVEAGYVPPLRVCGVKAHMFAAAVARRFTLAPAWGAALRASAHGGLLDGAITCSGGAVKDAADLTCFGGSPSDDKVRPLAFALDGIVTFAGWRGRRFEPYLMVGVRRERVGFDVNYVRLPSQSGGGYPALDDHTRLQATLTRVHGALGASGDLSGRLRLGGELYYAPGAVVTVRGRAAYGFGRGS